MKMQSRNRGFTLIEILITIAILAIVVVLGSSFYGEEAKKARRSDAKVALTDAAQVLERCRTNTNSYSGCSFNTTSPEGYYSISASSVTASTYTLTATAQGAQADDNYCKTFTLAHTGAKSGTNADCW
jgi:type IV pilus assembly protein PilE